MTYLQFLLIFVVPLIVIEAWLFNRAKDAEKKSVLRGILLLAFMAVVYTTPWDNYLIMTEVWSYEASRVIGKIGYVPIEEYMFFVLQSLLSGLWCYFVQRRFKIRDVASKKGLAYWTILAIYICIFLMGLRFLTQIEGRYLGLILVWALPIVLIQWLVGGTYLLSNFKTFMWSLWPVTIYLVVIDAIAIHLQVWKISMTQTTGLFLYNLPIEEATFFLLTNLMLVQGLILFIAMKNQFPTLTRRLKLRGSA